MIMWLIVLLSIVFGISMKLADAFNEHGIKWFKGDALLFGVVFGFSGGMLMILNPNLTNLYLSLLLVNILRYRVDRLNHGIAAVIMFLSYLSVGDNLDWSVLLYFLISFSIFGLLLELVVKDKKSTLAKIFEARFFYFLFTFLFSLYAGQWIVFVSMALFQFFYNFTSWYVKRLPGYRDV